jgi:hypothetical protein
MDIIKFVVRSLLRGEVNLFHHRYSMSMKLIHDKPEEEESDVEASSETEDVGPEHAEHVVTKYALLSLSFSPLSLSVVVFVCLGHVR